MAKSKSAYFCQNCGYESPKWMGQCPSCKQWNSFVEEVVEKASSKVPEWRSSTTGGSTKRANKAAIIHEIVYQDELRILTPDQEFNRVLGGGIVPGSLVLIGGEPRYWEVYVDVTARVIDPTSQDTLYFWGRKRTAN
ncbi:DNA repair protein RadA [Sphingobacterium multivorum]|uniref:DNA repair protein RadA n=1 Tax=Sphingobacterium multivorum TaxID=28454 RepID=A0A2X2J3L5_SPHMU|nr:DNA repair protein RadA [Sphingobacterium multivorum]